VLHALTLPASVETGPAGVDVVVTARITDDLSGVAAETPCGAGPILHTQVALKAPNARLFVGSILTARGGDVFEALLELPSYAQTGTWLVDRVVLTDCAGNSRTLWTTDLAAAGFPTTMQVTGTGDAEPPRLAAMSIAPPSVDTSAGEAVVTVSATLTDNLAGVAGSNSGTACGQFSGPRSQITFRSPAGVNFQGALFDPAGGDSWTGTIRMPRFSAAGTWTLDHVHLVDCAENSVSLRRADVEALGLPTSFEVTGVSDTTAPVVSALSVTPPVVDARTAPADVVIVARLTDDLSGVAGSDPPGGCTRRSRVSAIAPSGFASGFAADVFDLRAGDDYGATLQVPAGAEPGVWALSLHLEDCAGNQRDVAAADLAALGLPSSFLVLPPAYEFGGFMAPLDETAMAKRTPGSGMAVKFTLGGAEGTDVFDPGFPQVQQIDCATREPVGDAVPLAGNEWVFQSLTDGLYHFKWKSQTEWRHSCRRLTLGFDDGSRHSADVRFS
jgi:hypothetical protein